MTFSELQSNCQQYLYKRKYVISKALFEQKIFVIFAPNYKVELSRMIHHERVRKNNVDDSCRKTKHQLSNSMRPNCRALKVTIQEYNCFQLSEEKIKNLFNDFDFFSISSETFLNFQKSNLLIIKIRIESRISLNNQDIHAAAPQTDTLYTCFYRTTRIVPRKLIY